MAGGQEDDLRHEAHDRVPVPEHFGLAQADLESAARLAHGGADRLPCGRRRAGPLARRGREGAHQRGGAGSGGAGAFDPRRDRLHRGVRPAALHAPAARVAPGGGVRIALARGAGRGTGGPARRAGACPGDGSPAARASTAPAPALHTVRGRRTRRASRTRPAAIRPWRHARFSGPRPARRAWRRSPRDSPAGRRSRCRRRRCRHRRRPRGGCCRP